MVKNTFALVVAIWILTGCVAGQHLRLDHSPVERRAAERGNGVSVQVEDVRSYVVNQDKEDYYLGRYRAGLGNTWDVTTYDRVPLKDQILADLREELENMGFGLRESGKNLLVSIVDWNFDGYQNGRFWYELKVSVTDSEGNAVASDTLKGEIVIKGTVLGGAKAGFEREMPGHYDKVIDDILRNNADILTALES